MLRMTFILYIISGYFTIKGACNLGLKAQIKILTEKYRRFCLEHKILIVFPFISVIRGKV